MLTTIFLRASYWTTVLSYISEGYILTLRPLMFILNDPYTYIYISMSPSVLLPSCFLLPCYFLHLRFKYFPQHSFPKHPKPSLCRSILHPYNMGKIIVLFVSYVFMYSPGISFSFSFNIHINDCPITITIFSDVILFIDNTGVLVSYNKYDDCQQMFKSVLSYSLCLNGSRQISLYYM
jgi:hypothetical protein